MLQISYIKENKEEVIKRLAVKNFNAADIIEKVLAVDKERRNIQQSLDQILSETNKISKEIGILFGQNKKTEAEPLKKQTAELKEKSKILGEQLTSKELSLNELLTTIPNIPDKEVPAGKSPEDNIVVAEGGKIPEAMDKTLPHWELATKYNIIDFELGNKITGAGFPVYKGKGAKLQRALISFFLDKAIEAGYTEVQPPLLVNKNSGFGTGQLPDKDGQMYYIEKDDFYLIPTAEVPVTNIFRDVILDEKELPQKFTAYTPCFRREAGSYGKDVRGLNRLHQFDKVEVVQIVHPEKSYDVLNTMVDYVKGLLEQLELPYRVLKLCGGDMSFTSALTFDMEVYSVAQKRWLEVSSVSNFESYQANRLKLRFKDAQNKKQLAHTLNGSALALPRIVAALLENNQSEKGIKMPKVLVPYTGFEVIS